MEQRYKALQEQYNEQNDKLIELAEENAKLQGELSDLREEGVKNVGASNKTSFF